MTAPMTWDDKIAAANDLDALLQKASELHYMVAVSEVGDVARQTVEGNSTVYDGTALALTQLLAAKWPGVNPEWLRDLWVDLLDVPSQRDVEAMVESRLNRDDEHDPSVVAHRYAERMVRACAGDAAFDEPGGWTADADSAYVTFHDAKYREQAEAVKRLARDMAKPAHGK